MLARLVSHLLATHVRIITPEKKKITQTSIDERQGTAREGGALPGRGGGVKKEREASSAREGAPPAVERRRQRGGVSPAGKRATREGGCNASEGAERQRGGGNTTREGGGAARRRCRQPRRPVDQGALRWSKPTAYSQTPKNPTLQLFRKSSKSASTTPQRAIWKTLEFLQ